MGLLKIVAICTHSFLYKPPTNHFTANTTMASSSSSSSSSVVTEEQFKMFHNIDRIVFSRLIHDLHRNPGEAMQVIAFWLWLERSGLCRNLVNSLLTRPDTLLESLTDESVLLLTCMESGVFPLSFESIDIPLTQCMTKNRISLNFFRENRFSILHGVTKNVNEVCARAFEDILLQLVVKNKRISDGNTENVLGGNEIMKQVGPVTLSRGVMSEQHFRGFDPYAARSFQRNHDVLSNEIGKMLSHLRISNSSNSEQETERIIIPPDDRTIFLTFSKGYPISENEISDYFTRKFGECIEAIYMQEVSSMEQSLYARLVVYSSSFMEVVLEGKSKAKFSINGKHVWARKYVRKLRI